MPHVASSAADLLERVRPALHLEHDRVVIDDPAAAPRRRRSGTSPGRPRSARTRAPSRPRSGSPGRPPRRLGARSASIHELYVARARGEVAGFTVPAINIRAQTFDMARIVFETAAAARRRRGHPRAGAERADVHLPAADRLRDGLPRRRRRGRLAGPGLPPGRPLPVQRQEVRRRPGVDDRGDPAGLPPGDRRRLPQHRHRLLDARRPLEAERRRGAARELPPDGRAHARSSGRSRPTA